MRIISDIEFLMRIQKKIHCQTIQDNDGAGLSHFIVNLKL